MTDDGFEGRSRDRRTARSPIFAAYNRLFGFSESPLRVSRTACRLSLQDQISPAAQPARLDEVLARRGYARHRSTVVLGADIRDLVASSARHSPCGIKVTERPIAEWMNLWCAVDGRGDTRGRSTAHDILTGGPALYVSVHDANGVSAVGRAALIDEWAGVYCMATRPGARRRGLGRAALRALLAAAADRGARRSWLQVVADNAGARELYRRAGFTEMSAYHCRVLGAGR